MFRNKTVKFGFIIFILSILTACYEQKVPSASTTTTVLPDNSKKGLFQAYEGAWTDQEYNYKQCMFCNAEIDIGFPDSKDNPIEANIVDVFLTFYDGISSERVIDASSKVSLNLDGVGKFAIHDMSGFYGSGEIRLEQDQIVVSLKVSAGLEKAKDIFKSPRTFLRNPYQDVTLADPIELAKLNCGNCANYTMKLEPGVEWHEGLFSGEYLEVVNAWNQNEEIVRQFIVNTVNKSVKENYLGSQPRNTFWDSRAAKISMGPNGPTYFNYPEDVSLDDLKAGLKFANPEVRWYCAYKITEALAESNRDELTKLVRPLMVDTDEKVRKAAKFTISLLTRAYDSDNFSKTKNSEIVAFFKYKEAQYNDGNVWMVKNDLMKLLYKVDGSINQMSISLDGKWLAVVVNRKNDYPKIPIDILGTYSYMTFKEWSPDSKKFLFYYEFLDSETNGYDGFAVYDIKSGKVEKIYKTTSSSSKFEQRPADFEW
jgi:hypothetical protein